MPATPVTIAVTALEYAMLLVGLVLLWRHVLSPRARAAGAFTVRLAPWDIPATDFLLYLFVIIAGGFFGAFVSGLVLRAFTLSADTKTIFSTAAFQFGMLIGPAVLPLQLGHHPLLPKLDRRAILSGLATFLIALPIVTLVTVVWLWLLKLAGVPEERQDLLRMFLEADSLAPLSVLIGLATFVAPVAEELLFRATLFRYLRTHTPRWAAIVISALIFAAFHQYIAAFAPLAALAVVFAFAYERTGNIATTMIAHGLFNLHTVVLLLSGVTQ